MKKLLLLTTLGAGILVACSSSPKTPKPTINYETFSCDELLIEKEKQEANLKKHQFDDNLQTGMAILNVISMFAGGGNMKYSTDDADKAKKAEKNIEHLNQLATQKECAFILETNSENKTVL